MCGSRRRVAEEVDPGSEQRFALQLPGFREGAQSGVAERPAAVQVPPEILRRTTSGRMLRSAALVGLERGAWTAGLAAMSAG